MDIGSPTPLLGGLSAAQFMRRHWQKKPLLVRAALPDATAFLSRAELLALAGEEDVESRLVQREDDRWTLRQGPFARRALPSLATREWTLLVQGVDLHLDSAHRLLQRFRFIPDARLDDIMVSFATDGGGVGPHIDSYDVFLLQVSGRRRWRVGRVKKPVLRADVPLKILENFVATHEWLLEPGDMLYLPPGWGHDGTAEGEAITASIGFRAAGAQSLGAEVLHHLLDAFDPPDREALYADAGQPAVQHPARIPPELQAFANASVARLLAQRYACARALGEALSTPKPGVWFEPGRATTTEASLSVHRATRMLYDERHVYINGEAYLAAGRDATLVRRLADERALSAADLRSLSSQARELLASWIEAGWLEPSSDDEDPVQRR